MDRRDQILAKLALGLGLINQAGLQRILPLRAQFPGRSLDRILLDTGMIDAQAHQRLVQAFNDAIRRAKQGPAPGQQAPRRSAQSAELRRRGLSDSDVLTVPGATPGSARMTDRVQVPHQVPESGTGEVDDLEVPDDIFDEPTMVLKDDEDEGGAIFDQKTVVLADSTEDAVPILQVPDDDDGPLTVEGVSDEAPIVLRPGDDEEAIFAEPTVVLKDEGSGVYEQATSILEEDEDAIYAEPTLVLGEDGEEIYEQSTEVLDEDPDQPLDLAPREDSGRLDLAPDPSADPRLAEPGARDSGSGRLDAVDVRLKKNVDMRKTGPIRVPGAKSKKGTGALTSKEFQRRLKMRLGFEGFTIGDYEILGEISRGAFGVVLDAKPSGVTKSIGKDRGYEGNVALKVALENKTDPRATERFLEETRVQIGFDHPHIVRIFDCDVENGLTYYSMERIDGIEARSHVLKNGPMPPLLAVRIVKEIASALAYVHQQRIYHRDLKPHNILLDQSASPWRSVLIDFGLVTEHLEDKDKGLILGTPSYMPPEQAQPRGGHGPINATSDIYALGATFYFFLTGRAPFTDRNPRKIIQMVVNDPPRDLLELNPQVPRRIADVCLKCLSKAQRDRYHSAKKLQTDLEKELKSGQRMLKAKSFLGRFIGKKKP